MDFSHSKWSTNSENILISSIFQYMSFKNILISSIFQYMSFSAHADAKGIMQLISHCCPANVMLVHGEAVKMEFLRVSWPMINTLFLVPTSVTRFGEIL